MRNLFLFYLLTLLLGNPFLALLFLLFAYLLADVQFLGFSRRLIERIKIAGAIWDLEKIVSLNPDNATAQRDLGRLLVARRDYQNALTHLEKALPRMEDQAETNYYVGLAYLHTGREEDGLQRIEKALSLNPRLGYGEPYLRLGEYYARSGKHTEAEEMYQKHLDIHTSSTEGYYRLGHLFLKMGKTDKAKEALSRSIEVFKLSPWYKKRGERRWVWLARLLLLQMTH